MDIVILRIAESLASRAHTLANEGRTDGAEAVLAEADGILTSYSISPSRLYQTEYEVTVRELARHGVMFPSKYLVEGVSDAC